MPFILVILGEVLALVIGYVWKARRLARRNVHLDVHFPC